MGFLDRFKTVADQKLTPEDREILRKYNEDTKKNNGKIIKNDNFEQIIGDIRSSFKPQKITNEDHLQAQITIFLQATYPGITIEREVITSKGDKLDIFISRRYVLEVKVPQNRTDLRNLTAQLEEYKEQYPEICAIIFDDESLNLSQVIKDYVAKYERKLGIKSIIISGKKRN